VHTAAPAARLGRPELVGLLLDAVAEPSRVAEDGRRPLDVVEAALARHAQVAALLRAGPTP